MTAPLIEMRGEQAFQFIARARAATVKQIQCVVRPKSSEASIRAALERHAEGGTIKSVRLDKPGTKLWFLTKEGVSLARKWGLIDDPRVMPAPPSVTKGDLTAHQRAVVDGLIPFYTAAYARGDATTWDPEMPYPLTSRRPIITADAILKYELKVGEGIAHEWRFIELDRGTFYNRPLQDLIDKVRRYNRLLETPDAWKDRGYLDFPPVLFIMAGPRSKAYDRMISVARALQKLYVVNVDVSFCLFDDLVEQGPFAPIARRLSGQWDQPAGVFELEEAELAS